MFPLTKDIPKPLLPAGEKNLIEWKIAALPPTVTEIILVVGYLGEKIRDHFGDTFEGKRISYVEQKELNGTMGALIAAEELLHDRFLVMMGDDLYGREDIARILDHEYAIGVSLVENVFRGGELVCRDDGTLDFVIEEKKAIERGYINTGLYALSRGIFAVKPVAASNGNAEIGLPQTLALFGRSHPVPVVTVEKWLQITAPDDLPRAALFGRNALILS